MKHLFLVMILISFAFTSIITVEALETHSFVAKWGTSGSGDGEFDIPAGIAFDSAGNIYVVDQGNDRIQKFNSTGDYISQFGGIHGSGPGEFISAQAIAFDVFGNIYVVDQSNHRVQKFSSSGVYISQFGSFGSNDEEFNIPFGMAFDSSGNIYVTDENNHRVQKFTSLGVYISQFGSFGTDDGEFDTPSGIAIDSSGNIYVADTFNHRIQKFNSTGSYISQFGSFGSGDGQFDGPNYIAIDSSGDVIVADTGNYRLQKFNSTGSYLTQFGSSGSGDGQFDILSGIAIDSSGNIFVSDTGNDRIQKLGHCEIPDTGSWVVVMDCALGSSAIAPANVMVQNNSVLTIPSDTSLHLNKSNSISIINGSGIFIQSGGKVQFHEDPIGVITIQAQTDLPEYENGNTVVVNGTMTGFVPEVHSGMILTYRVLDTSDNIVTIGQSLPNSDGTFNFNFIVGGIHFKETGFYTIELFFDTGTGETSMFISV